MTRTVRCLTAMLVGAVLFAGCTDAPEAPTGAGRLPAVLQIQPTFSPVLLQSAAALSALSEAFEQVDRFRMIVRRLSGEIVFDEIIEVTPGADSYELSAAVPVRGSTEQFLVDLIAMEGETELFRSENVQVRAVSGSVSETADVSDAELQYVGPGADAAAIALDPFAIVLTPGATGEITAAVVDEGGAPVTGVPVGWETSDPAVATVEDGTITGHGEGHALVTATTPTGIAAEAHLYVVSGSLAFARGGSVFRGSVGGSSAEEVGEGGQPAFGPGGVLYWAVGGRVIQEGQGTVAGGIWPALAPDGTKIASESGGRVVVTNIDGTRPTPGPDGRGPQWAGPAEFVVGGGSIDLVDADGSRTELVAGNASRPVLSGGRMAWTSGGTLFVSGSDGSDPVAVMSGVSGRPALSPDGDWAIGAGGSALMIAPANGSGPALPLGHGAASDPVWRTGGGASAPQPVVVSGLEPEAPAAGEEVTILGSGFDVLIPDNNKVMFTVAGGSAVSSPGSARVTAEAPILGVTSGGIRTLVPENVVAGPITVETFTSSSDAFVFEPPTATIGVTVVTTTGHLIEGASVTLTDEDGNEFAGTTGSDGHVFFDGLQPSTYSTAPGLPAGFTLVSGPDPVEVGFGDVEELEATARANVVSVSVSPESPSLIVAHTTTVEVEAIDALGNVVTDHPDVRWESLTPLRARHRSGDFQATLLGILPSPGATVRDASFRVTVDGVSAEFSANVSTFVGGSVTDLNGDPVGGVEIQLIRAGNPGPIQRTGANGGYHFGGLHHGEFGATIIPPAGYSSAPGSYAWTIGNEVPAGRGDFTIGMGSEDAFTLLPESVERLPGGTQQFVTDGNEGPFNWTVNGTVGGNSTFGTITSSGFYTAPGSIPTPSTFQVCAVVQGQPGVSACSDVTINPIPTAGEDVIVVNDLNFFRQGVQGNASNQRFIRNIVNYTADGFRAQTGTVVQWDDGHNDSCNNGCKAASFPAVVTQIEAQGYTIRQTESAVGGLATIQNDVKVLFLIMPTIAYTVDEINAFKQFAAEGGRIVFMGEHSGFYPELAIENQFLEDMGAEMTNIGAQHSCGILTFDQTHISSHQTTTGMTDYTMGCASEVVPGPNDFTLFMAERGFNGGGAFVPIGGVAKIDTTPLPAGAPARIVSPGESRMEKTHDAVGRPLDKNTLKKR